MRIGLYPGTFDPLTFGHIDIIQRAAGLVDRLVIGVAINREKKPLFSADERVDIIRVQIEKLSAKLAVDIIIHKFDTLLIDCAKEIGASVVFRGLRAVSDFEYEFQMVGMNRALDDSIETVFLMADVNHQATASKLVKEISRFGGKINNFVPEEVSSLMAQKFKKNYS